MRLRILTLALLLLGVATMAAASGYGCTQTTVTTPDGRTLRCDTCCDPYGDNCRTTCS